MKNQKVEKPCPSEKIQQEYDRLIELVLLNIWGTSKHKQNIRLYCFDRKNKEHLLFLRVALIVRDQFGFPIEIDASRWDVFCLNRKLCKYFDKVKRFNRAKCVQLLGDSGILMNKVVEFMKEDGVARCGENFTFADIYDTYYKGDCD